MAARLGQRPHDAFEDVARRLIGTARAALDLEDPERSVHEARRALKRVRSAIELYRVQIPGKARRELVSAVSGVSKALAPRREADAINAAMRRIERVGLLSEEDRGVLRTMRASSTGPSGATTGRARGRSVLARALRGIEALVAALKLPPPSEDDLGRGVRRALRRARRAMRDAAVTLTPEAFHAWRKEVKHLCHHAAMLKEAWPEGDLPKPTLERLGRWLGEAHDLAMLHEYFLQNSERLKSPKTALQLSALVDARRARLEHRALAAGAKLMDFKSRRLACIVSRRLCEGSAREPESGASRVV